MLSVVGASGIVLRSLATRPTTTTTTTASTAPIKSARAAEKTALYFLLTPSYSLDGDRDRYIRYAHQYSHKKQYTTRGEANGETLHFGGPLSVL